MYISTPQRQGNRKRGFHLHCGKMRTDARGNQNHLALFGGSERLLPLSLAVSENALPIGVAFTCRQDFSARKLKPTIQVWKALDDLNRIRF
jgi:hypothetical protein